MLRSVPGGPSTRPPTSPALELKNVWKLYGSPNKMRAAARSVAKAQDDADRASVQKAHGVFAALAGVDLEVRQNETLAIVGQSGSGKSTLVRHLNGLLTPTTGQVVVQGRDISTLRTRALQALRATQVGMVFQSTSLFPHRTVLENVVFGLEVRGVPRRDAEATARKWLERVELLPWIDRYPSELSGGMQQRVGLARTLATDPEILLLDEPFSALDPLIRRSLQDEFVALVAEYRKTAVFITHDFAEAIRIADRIAVMTDGRIVQVGTPREILFTPATAGVASFATQEAKAGYVQASDIARRGPHPVARAITIPARTPLSDLVSRINSDGDLCFHVVDASGDVLGWIDRSVLIACMDDMLGSAPAGAKDTEGCTKDCKDCPRQMCLTASSAC
ncbi:MAG: ATP-binding cassette domain-containing protein [Celeribacter sp.]